MLTPLLDLKTSLRKLKRYVSSLETHEIRLRSSPARTPTSTTSKLPATPSNISRTYSESTPVHVKEPEEDHAPILSPPSNPMTEANLSSDMVQYVVCTTLFLYYIY